MAKFGQGFLTSLTRPSYLNRLGNTGMMIGQMPGQVMKQRRQRRFMEDYVAGSPVQRAEMLKKKGIQEGNIGLFEQGSKMGNAAMADGAKMGVNALITQIRNPETSDELAEQSIQTALQLIRNNGLDEASYMKEILAANKYRKETPIVEKNAEYTQAKALAEKAAMSGDPTEFITTYGGKYYRLLDEAKRSRRLKSLKLEADEQAFDTSQIMRSIVPIENNFRSALQEPELNVELLREYENGIVEILRSNNLSTKGYEGMTASAIQARKDQEWDSYVKNKQAQEVNDNAFVDRVAAQAMEFWKTNNNVDDFLDGVFLDNKLTEQQKSLEPRIRKKVQDDLKELRESRERQESGVFNRAKWMKDNPDYFAGDDQVKSMLSQWENAADGTEKKRQLARKLNVIVDKAQAAQRKVDVSDEGLSVIVDDAIRLFSKEKSEMLFFEWDDDVVEVFNDVMDDPEESQELRRRMKVLFKKNPNANYRTVIKRSLEQMQKDMSGEAVANVRRNYRNIKQELQEKAIRAVMVELGIEDREEAERIVNARAAKRAMQSRNISVTNSMR